MYYYDKFCFAVEPQNYYSFSSLIKNVFSPQNDSGFNGEIHGYSDCFKSAASLVCGSGCRLTVLVMRVSDVCPTWFSVAPWFYGVIFLDRLRLTDKHVSDDVPQNLLKLIISDQSMPLHIYINFSWITVVWVIISMNSRYIKSIVRNKCIWRKQDGKTICETTKQF